MIHSTNAVDYAVERVVNGNDTLRVELTRRGDLPMPQDLAITWEDGSITQVHIPLVVMRGHRALMDEEVLGVDWPWVNPIYTYVMPSQGKRVKVELDPAQLVADIHRENNVLTFDLTVDQAADQPY